MVEDNPFRGPSAPLDVPAPTGGAGRIADAERIRKEHLTAETNIRSIGTLHIVGAILGSLGMVAVAIPAFMGKEELPAPLSIAVVATWCAIGLVYAAHMASGIGLRKLRRWARIPSVVLSALGLLAFPVGTLIGGIFLYVLLNKKAARIFAPDYEAIVRQTPHIRYRTSVVTWIIFGLIVAVLIAALIGMTMFKMS
ncbi:MAG: hypothetical protein H6729_08870 [Deltaproteobacteria bacterium]|nr:hypothetical protein [Deltaproteobacteria bacterium]